MSLDSLNLAELAIWNMPGFFMIKDNSSKILNVNKNALPLLGFKKLDQIIGTTDYESNCDDVVQIADQLVKEDKKTRSLNTELSILYIINAADGNKYAINSIKKTLMLPSGEVGVICQGTFLNSKTVALLASNFEKTSSKFINKHDIITRCYYIDSSLDSSVILPKQQSLCLYYLIRGKTANDIAKILNISKRTVESYVENIKLKFDCDNKSELIEKTIGLGYLYCLPSDIFFVSSND